jgi:PTH1 family peptidyl-tRNA hydrolase
MKVIVGLGNPGEQYKSTRHNAGFIFVEQLACASEFSSAGECLKFSKNEKFQAEIAETLHRGEKIILAKPLTFMNLSGQSVQKIMDYYKAESADLIVVADDKDLPIGTVRVRREGSSAGQKGLQNIIDVLGTDQLLRIRIGINAIGGDADLPKPKDDRFETADFVLSKFDKRELPVLDESIKDTIAYIVPFIGGEEAIPAHTIAAKIDSLQYKAVSG